MKYISVSFLKKVVVWVRAVLGLSRPEQMLAVGIVDGCRLPLGIGLVRAGDDASLLAWLRSWALIHTLPLSGREILF